MYKSWSCSFILTKFNRNFVYVYLCNICDSEIPDSNSYMYYYVHVIPFFSQFVISLRTKLPKKISNYTARQIKVQKLQKQLEKIKDETPRRDNEIIF